MVYYLVIANTKALLRNPNLFFDDFYRYEKLFIDLLQYKRVVTFGDSTIDSGTAYQLLNHTYPPVPPGNSNSDFAEDLL